jgi:predicted dehydrogenase
VPHFAEAARLAEKGALGRLLFAEAHYVHDMRPVLTATPWRYQAPQDLVFGGACHPIDLLVWILGEVAEVSAMGQTSGMDARYPPHLEDNFLINLRFANGTIGRVLATFGLVEPPMPMLGLNVFGTAGSVVQENVRFDGAETRPLDIAREAGHANEVIRYLRHFEDCLVNDREPMINASVGAHVIRVCEAVWASVRSGQTVAVNSIREPLAL